MDIDDFYSDPDLADGFGSTKYPRTNPHYGLDFAHALGTPIPAYSPGVVHISEYHGVLGNIVEVRGDNGRYMGFRHMRTNTRLPVGSRVEIGTIVGQVSDTGSAAYGYHLCTTNASAPGGVYGTSACSDPWPWITAALENGNLPASVPTGMTRLITNGDSDMPKIHRRQDNGKAYFITNESVHHISHVKELPGLRYSAGYADKNASVNEDVSKDDFRIIIQAYGFDYGKVAALAPGETILRNGTVIPRQVWPAVWS